MPCGPGDLFFPPPPPGFMLPPVPAEDFLFLLFPACLGFSTKIFYCIYTYESNRESIKSFLKLFKFNVTEALL
jgi:hypothetical protein